MMKDKSVLIVDDEKNIRLTLSQALEVLEVETATAADGEEALARLKEKEFSLILLDLKMPGMDGMEVLRQVSEIRPDIRIIILTAYGTVESAVKAMKLGAADFIQKPFAAEEIRGLVSRVLDRGKIDEQKTVDYASSVELAKRCIGDRHFDAAVGHVRKAISLDPSRPEAFNLLGALMEIRGDRIEAQKNYRAALSLDPSYEPAIKNLQRSTNFRWKMPGGMLLEEAKKEEKKENK
jgi:DNA-binding response OmpR family regulator